MTGEKIENPFKMSSSYHYEMLAEDIFVFVWVCC